MEDFSTTKVKTSLAKKRKKFRPLAAISKGKKGMRYRKKGGKAGNLQTAQYYLQRGNRLFIEQFGRLK